ncbi:hypothetical protein BC834DRAFT_173043 [Gloeopeniophorella convolvens]|nr:hypothetical protein BC834DRAFT_173043 [Gloeopeniophorella convolvens]
MAVVAGMINVLSGKTRKWATQRCPASRARVIRKGRVIQISRDQEEKARSRNHLYSGGGTKGSLTRSSAGSALSAPWHVPLPAPPAENTTDSPHHSRRRTTARKG